MELDKGALPIWGPCPVTLGLTPGQTRLFPEAPGGFRLMQWRCQNSHGQLGRKTSGVSGRWVREDSSTV